MERYLLKLAPKLAPENFYTLYPFLSQIITFLLDSFVSVFYYFT